MEALTGTASEGDARHRSATSRAISSASASNPCSVSSETSSSIETKAEGPIVAPRHDAASGDVERAEWNRLPLGHRY